MLIRNKIKFAKGGGLSKIINLDSGQGDYNTLQYHMPTQVNPFVNTGIDPRVFLEVQDNVNKQVLGQRKEAQSNIPDFQKIKEALKLQAHSGANIDIENQFEAISKDYNDKFSKDYNYAFTREGLSQKQALIGLVDNAKKSNAEQLFKDNQEIYGEARKNKTLGDPYIKDNEVHYKGKDGNVYSITPEKYDSLPPEDKKLIQSNVLTQQKYYDLYDKFADLKTSDRIAFSQNNFDNFARNVKEKFAGLGYDRSTGRPGVGVVNVGNPNSPIYQLGQTNTEWKNNSKQIAAIRNEIVRHNLISQSDLDAFTANYIAKTGDISGKGRDKALVDYIDAVAKGESVDDFAESVQYKNLPDDLSSTTGGLPKPNYTGTGTYGIAVLGLDPHSEVKVPMQDSDGKIINTTGNLVQELKPEVENYKDKEGKWIPLPIAQTPVFKSAPAVYNAFGVKVPEKSVFNNMIYGSADKVIIDVPVTNGELDFDKYKEIETLRKQLEKFPNSPGIQEKINQIKQNTIRVQKAEIVFNEYDADKLGRGKYYEGTEGKNIDAPFADRSLFGLGSELIVTDSQGNKHYNTKAKYLSTDDADAQRLKDAGFSNGQAYKTTIYIPISTIQASKIDQEFKTNTGENALNPQLPARNIIPEQNRDILIPFRGN